MPDNNRRASLLKEVLQFVERSRHCPGVIRIALVGSLTTTKPLPKDADVLVTIDETTDTKRLAALGRKLKGATQALASGADIFLCTPAGQYLGRTCSWRSCHFRAACTGHSCGIGTYIRDDLDIICLDAALAKSPPIELWPAVIRRKRAPKDVEAILLQPLSQMTNGDNSTVTLA